MTDKSYKSLRVGETCITLNSTKYYNAKEVLKAIKRFASIATIISLFIILLTGCNEPPDVYFGKYQGTVQAEWIGEREMKLLADFSFTDPEGMVWMTKKGDMIDGASIPSPAWTLIGSPFVGKYREASVIHDVACDEKKRNWELVHLTFYNAMRTSGVSETKAQVMYAAVYHRGPRWTLHIKKLISKAQTQRVRVDSSEGRRYKTVYIPAKYKTEIIKPRKKTLDKKELNTLIEKIQKSEKKKTPFTLESIRAYKK